MSLEYSVYLHDRHVFADAKDAEVVPARHATPPALPAVLHGHVGKVPAQALHGGRRQVQLLHMVLGEQRNARAAVDEEVARLLRQLALAVGG